MNPGVKWAGSGFGLEHEVAFIDKQGQFADYTATGFHEFAEIIDELPLYEQDYPQLRIGDAKIKWKRWYIEGFERYDLSGKVTDCPPKGIEIRTTIQPTIQGAVAELAESFQRLREVAEGHGFTPVLISYNPYRARFEPDPPLNTYEREHRQMSPEKQTAFLPMSTYGPDLNFSVAGLSTAEVIDIGRKLTYYSPYIIPFSFSSPFFEGKLWDGLSVRTFIRTGARPAAMVFLAKREDLLQTNPSLTKIARIPAEAGRIEFKACDSCGTFELYGALLALLKGLLLDKSLAGRATVPDAALHQLVARQGFEHKQIAEGTEKVLLAAEQSLQEEADRALLAPLWNLFQRRETPAHEMIRVYRQTASIEQAMRAPYQFSRIG